jgi:hypothetical protein
VGFAKSLPFASIAASRKVRCRIFAVLRPRFFARIGLGRIAKQPYLGYDFEGKINAKDCMGLQPERAL